MQHRAERQGCRRLESERAEPFIHEEGRKGPVPARRCGPVVGELVRRGLSGIVCRLRLGKNRAGEVGRLTHVEHALTALGPKAAELRILSLLLSLRLGRRVKLRRVTTTEAIETIFLTRCQEGLTAIDEAISFPEREKNVKLGRLQKALFGER